MFLVCFFVLAQDTEGDPAGGAVAVSGRGVRGARLHVSPARPGGARTRVRRQQCTTLITNMSRIPCLHGAKLSRSRSR